MRYNIVVWVVHGVIVICVALFEGYIFGKSVALKVEITGKNASVSSTLLIFQFRIKYANN